MKVTLRQLTRKNFQGEGTTTFNFSDKNIISGDNQTGKTKTYSSELWLLYGKNEKWESKFDICPLDSKNYKIPYLETEVEGVFDIDGTELKLKKVIKRKWDTGESEKDPRLVAEPVTYYIHGSEVKKKDYDKRISDIMDESLFKLLSTTDYFTSLPWKERRAMILDWFGEIDPVITDEKYTDLFTYLNEKKMSLDNYRKDIATELKGINDTLIELPIRIDELNGQKKELPEVDNDAVESAKDKLATIELEKTDTAKANAENNNKIISLQDDILVWKKEISNIKAEGGKHVEKDIAVLKEQLNECVVETNKVVWKKTSIENDITTLTDDIKKTKSDLLVLRAKYKSTANKDIEDKCFYCGGNIDAKEIEEQKGKKAKELKTINTEGQKMGKDLSTLEDTLKVKEDEVTKYIRAIKDFDTAAHKTQVLITVLKDKPLVFDGKAVSKVQELIDKALSSIAAIEKQKTNPIDMTDEIQTLNVVVAQEQTYKDTVKHNKDIQVFIERRKSEMESAREMLADVMQRDHVFKDYEQKRYTLIETEINKHFETIQFKMFEQIKNGEWKAICKLLVNGVDYHSTLNTAGKANAGLSIIKFLHKKYNKYAPVWIDNAESVSKFVKLDTQMVYLKMVSGSKLKIENL